MKFEPKMDGSHNVLIVKFRNKLLEEFINNHYEKV